MQRRRRVGIACLALALGVGSAASAQPPEVTGGPELDYLFFKERVQPVFLERRAGHARCVTCHTDDRPRLEPLSPGASTWSNEQSRRNFDVWKELVVPGRPMDSPLLLGSLATAAGGSPTHAGGKRWASRADAEWQTLTAWVRGQRLGGLAMPWTTGVERVLQTSSAGDGVLVIDPAIHEVVGVIEGIEAPTGIAIAPGGRRVYVTNRGLNSLDVVDVRTLEVLKRIDLSGVPRDVAAAPDGDRVYVGIDRGDAGGVDVIDAEALTYQSHIPVDGVVEQVRLTPDGTHLFVTTPDTRTLQGIDVISHDAVTWQADLASAVEAIEFIRSGDGSTRYLIVQLDGEPGFTVVSFGTRQVLARVEPYEAIGARISSGLALSPDRETLWVAGGHDDTLVKYEVPERCRPGPPEVACPWERLGSVGVGGRPTWLTMTADGASLYVSLAGESAVAVVDTEEMALEGRVATGPEPGRGVSGALATR